MVPVTEIGNIGKRADWNETNKQTKKTGQISVKNIEMKVLVDAYVEMSHSSLRI